MKNKNYKSYLYPIICGVLLLGLSGVSFYLGNKAAVNGLIFKGTNEKVQSAFGEIKDIDKYNQLFTVRDAIISNYDGKVDDEKLLDGAIKGMTRAVGDKYTVYMNKEEYKEFNKQHTGKFVGIGVMISIKNGNVQIVSVAKNSPAEKAGLKSKDIILKINGEAIDKNSEKAVSLIRGKEGENLTLTIKREGLKGTKEINVKRETIKTKSVESKMINGNIGYVLLRTFATRDVSKEFKSEVDGLLNKGMKGMILDLRSNPGGFLTEVVDIASEFIPKGEVITYTIDKYDNKSFQKSKGDGRLNKMPLVLLVDKGSASASELLTTALRDYDLATIVGVNTYGKGVVQAPIEFKDGSALKVTISRYYSPKGLNINEKGIEPDVKVELPKEFFENEYNESKDLQLQEGIKIIKSEIKEN